METIVPRPAAESTRIVHRIVEEHGGAIRVDTTPGRGTTVSISLPLAGPAQGASAPAAPERATTEVS